MQRLAVLIPLCFLALALSCSGRSDRQASSAASPTSTDKLNDPSATSASRAAESPATPRTTAIPSPDATGLSLSEGEEAALAESLLLTLQDFPPGWAQVPWIDPETQSFADRCGSAAGPFTAKALAAFEQDDGQVGVDESLRIYPSADLASEAVESAELAAYVTCIADFFNEGGADEEETTYSGATVTTVSPLSNPPSGSARTDYELRINGTLDRGDGSSPFRYPVYIRMAFVSQGRFAFLVTGKSVLFPFDETFLDAVVEAVLRKIGN